MPLKPKAKPTPQKGNPIVPFSLRLPVDIDKALRAEKKRTGVDVSQIILKAVREHLGAQ